MGRHKHSVSPAQSGPPVDFRRSRRSDRPNNAQTRSDGSALQVPVSAGRSCSGADHVPWLNGRRWKDRLAAGGRCRGPPENTASLPNWALSNGPVRGLLASPRFGRRLADVEAVIGDAAAASSTAAYILGGTFGVPEPLVWVDVSVGGLDVVFGDAGEFGGALRSRMSRCQVAVSPV